MVNSKVTRSTKVVDVAAEASTTHPSSPEMDILVLVTLDSEDMRWHIVFETRS